MREANLYLCGTLVQVCVYVSAFQDAKYLLSERRCFKSRRDGTNRCSLARKRMHLVDDSRLLLRVKKSESAQSGYFERGFCRTFFRLGGSCIGGRDLPLLR